MSEEIFYRELVDRYKAKKASDEELMVFFHLLKEGQLDSYLNESFSEGIQGIADDMEGVHRIPQAKRSRLWPRIAVVASLLAIVSLVVLLFYYKPESASKVPDLTNNNTPDKSSPVYKTVSTGRGHTSETTLPDGTRIWVNAASSVRFPTVFAGKERIVELDGECYFEVTKNVSMPFRVRTSRGVEVRVLGTQFNMHAYRDEPITATLVEGSIRLHSGQDSVILKPGQKAFVLDSGKLSVVNADLEESLAWKNGYFHFNKADILTVMRQIEKWYDVEVVFEGQIPDKQFVGKVRRDSDITEVLEILRHSKVNFRMEGKKITIMP